MNTYYVYIILDTRKKGEYKYDDIILNFEPFYVGYGKGIRKNTTLKGGTKIKKNKINKIINDGYLPKVVKIFENLTQENAIEIEKKYISIIGREDLNKGTLVNMTDGGEGKPRYKITDETRNKMRLKKIGCIPWNKGKSWSDKTKKKISNSLKGEKNFNYGKHFSEDHRKKISESNKIAQSKPVSQFTKDGVFIKNYKSQLEASQLTGINKSIIGKCCRGIGLTAGGFIWKFNIK